MRGVRILLYFATFFWGSMAHGLPIMDPSWFFRMARDAMERLNGRTEPCPDGATAVVPAATLRPAVPTSCSGLGSSYARWERKVVTRRGEESMESYCGSDSGYRSMVGIALQSFRALAVEKDMVANQMSCLLGVDFTGAEMIDALAEMHEMVCSRKRNFIVDCKPESESTDSATFDPNTPFADARDDIAAGRGFTGVLELSASSVADARGDRLKAQGLVGAAIHESAHALADYLVSRYGAGGENRRSTGRSGDAGPSMTNQNRCGCPTDGAWDPPACGTEAAREAGDLGCCHPCGEGCTAGPRIPGSVTMSCDTSESDLSTGGFRRRDSSLDGRRIDWPKIQYWAGSTSYPSVRSHRNEAMARAIEAQALGGGRACSEILPAFLNGNGYLGI